MYINSAYLNKWPDGRIDTEYTLVNNEKPLLVTACGTYRLKHQPMLYTYRPNGRSDFQILYVASGKTCFFFDGVEQILPAGSIVIFRPGEPQLYKYFGVDQPEVYWVHFTGFDAEKFLRENGLWDTRVISVTPSSAWKNLFRHMIQELQLRKDLYCRCRRRVRTEHGRGRRAPARYDPRRAINFENAPLDRGILLS